MSLIDRICHKLVKDEEFTRYLPLILRVHDEKKLDKFMIRYRRHLAKRKILKWITFGKFPEPLYKTRRRIPLLRWIVRKLLS